VIIVTHNNEIAKRAERGKIIDNPVTIIYRTLRKINDGFKTLYLFILTALAEIISCYLPYLWLKKGSPAWLLLPAGVALFTFAWLLSLHPQPAGRVYAAYGGVYI
jgi:hypothetical protein